MVIQRSNCKYTMMTFVYVWTCADMDEGTLHEMNMERLTQWHIATQDLNMIDGILYLESLFTWLEITLKNEQDYEWIFDTMVIMATHTHCLMQTLAILRARVRCSKSKSEMQQEQEWDAVREKMLWRSFDTCFEEVLTWHFWPFNLTEWEVSTWFLELMIWFGLICLDLIWHNLQWFDFWFPILI